MRTIPEALERLTDRKASAAAGIQDQVRAAGGVLEISKDEVLAAHKLAFVSVDGFDAEKLDEVADLLARQGHVQACVGMLQAFGAQPGMLEQILSSTVAQAVVEGYLLRAMQEGGEADG